MSDCDLYTLRQLIEAQYREALEHAYEMKRRAALQLTKEEAAVYRQQLDFELRKAEGYRKQWQAVTRKLVRRKAR